MDNLHWPLLVFVFVYRLLMEIDSDIETNEISKLQTDIIRQVEMKILDRCCQEKNTLISIYRLNLIILLSSSLSILSLLK